MNPVEVKRMKISTKKSLYDPMIDAFIKSGHNLVEISVEDKKASYVITQLTKRIEKRNLDIIASAAQNFVYLELGKVHPKE
ncbi:hypothetical protein KKF82_06500 [Patescibacteria group bacterium]|nr:hypothetical protein [Patescibacteria group bacterium]